VAQGEQPVDTHPCNRFPCSGAGGAATLAFSGVLQFDVAMDVTAVTASATMQTAVERQIAQGETFSLCLYRIAPHASHRTRRIVS
jgi:hypothetical protein